MSLFANEDVEEHGSDGEEQSIPQQGHCSFPERSQQLAAADTNASELQSDEDAEDEPN
jgi:hypothetical protein